MWEMQNRIHNSRPNPVWALRVDAPFLIYRIMSGTFVEMKYHSKSCSFHIFLCLQKKNPSNLQKLQILLHQKSKCKKLKSSVWLRSVTQTVVTHTGSSLCTSHLSLCHSHVLPHAHFSDARSVQGLRRLPQCFLFIFFLKKKAPVGSVEKVAANTRSTSHNIAILKFPARHCFITILLYMTRGCVDQNIFMRRLFVCVCVILHIFSSLNKPSSPLFFKQQWIKASFASKYHDVKKIPSLHVSEVMWILKTNLCALSV